VNDPTDEAPAAHENGHVGRRREALFRRIFATAASAVDTAETRFGHVTAVRVVIATVRVFRQSSGTARSAEIAYWGILSTIPFAALCLTILAVASGFVEAGMTDARLLETARTLADTILPAAGQDLETAIAALLRERGALGAFGFVTLVLTSSLVFGAVNRALSQIFELRARGRLTTVMVFSVLLVALTLFFIIGAPALSTIASLVGVGEFLGGIGQSSLWFHVGGALSMAICFAFFIIFVVRASIRAVWVNVGTVVFVALFELARWGITTYLETVTNFNVVYGSLAGVMAAILWSYYIAFSLLITMCLVRALQDRLYDSGLGDLDFKFEPPSDPTD
jgi:membrane protein